MKKGVLFWGLLILLIASIIFIILPKINPTGFATQSIDASHLEELRLKAEVGCLQNSQCPGGFGCVGNVCVNKNEINLCQDFKLYSGSRRLEVGQPINSIKEVLTDGQLPYLLPDGEIVEEVNNELIEYFYIQVILIGDNKIEKENEYYTIANDKPLYIYRLILSTGVDFSNKNIRGQVLRILGEEYIIGSNSDNSNIYLVSNKENVRLQDKENVKITNDENGNVIMIEIEFFSQDKIKNNEANVDSVFSSTKLSFKYDNNFADVRIGGNC